MTLARAVVAQALAERASAGIKVRQPLGQLMIKSEKLKAERQLLELISDEVNVKKIGFDSALKAEVKLDKKITKELKEEGAARELVRQIQDMRKELGLTRKDRIAISFKYPARGEARPGRQISNLKLKKLFANWQGFILKETLAQEPEELEGFKPDLEKELELEEGKVKIGIKKTK
jgi:isoleucyl-tRNA synthetase